MAELFDPLGDLIAEQATVDALVQDFTDEQVRLSTAAGPLCVHGRNLTLCEVRENALIVHGCIRQVDLPEDGGAQ